MEAGVLSVVAAMMDNIMEAPVPTYVYMDMTEALKLGSQISPKISGIKAIRLLTDLGLKEAKELYEQLSINDHSPIIGPIMTVGDGVDESALKVLVEETEKRFEANGIRGIKYLLMC